MKKAIRIARQNRAVSLEILEFFLANPSLSGDEVMAFLESRRDPEWAKEFFQYLLLHGIIEETSFKVAIPGRIGGLWSNAYQLGSIDRLLNNPIYNSISLIG